MQVGVDAGPTWDWTCKFWELAYDGAMKDIKHEGAHVGVSGAHVGVSGTHVRVGESAGAWGHAGGGEWDAVCMSSCPQRE